MQAKRHYKPNSRGNSEIVQQEIQRPILMYPSGRFSISVTRMDYDLLNPGGWLSDTIMEFYRLRLRDCLDKTLRDRCLYKYHAFEIYIRAQVQLKYLENCYSPFDAIMINLLNHYTRNVIVVVARKVTLTGVSDLDPLELAATVNFYYAMKYLGMSTTLLVGVCYLGARKS
uniref:Uncharacterized protein n=1 Tax=Glossina pallidipes TaxID=7398 RepID=A0A1B0AHL7_GLOPL